MDDETQNEQWEAAIPLARRVAKIIKAKHSFVDVDDLTQELLLRWPKMKKEHMHQEFYYEGLRIVGDLDPLGLGVGRGVVEKKAYPKFAHLGAVGDPGESAPDVGFDSRLSDERLCDWCVWCGARLDSDSTGLCCRGTECSKMLSRYRKLHAEGFAIDLRAVHDALCDAPQTRTTLKVLSHRWEFCLNLLAKMGYVISRKKVMSRVEVKSDAKKKRRTTTYFRIEKCGVQMPTC